MMNNFKIDWMDGNEVVSTCTMDYRLAARIVSKESGLEESSIALALCYMGYIFPVEVKTEDEQYTLRIYKLEG